VVISGKVPKTRRGVERKVIVGRRESGFQLGSRRERGLIARLFVFMLFFVFCSLRR
jgi:hypothetical protein